MSLLKKNLVANFAGNIWQALMGIGFVPLYIKFLGIESYGLIGIFAVLQAWLTLLDIGMTPTLGREMARFTGGTHDAQSIHDLLRSIEIIGLGIAVLVALGIWVASGWMASDWLRAEKLPIDAVAQAFAIMGAVTAMRFIENIYRSSIVGLQRQVLLNVANSAMATLRGLGAVGILVWVSPTIKAFFVWQGLISIITVGLFASVVYRALPASPKPSRFSLSKLNGIWRFAGGMMAITVLATLLTQIDKIMLSKMLTLTDFGYYTLAGTVAGALYMLISPISTAVFPRLTELHARKMQQEFAATYHKASQLVSIIIVPSAVTLMFFSRELMLLWTRDPATSATAAPLVSMLVMGNMLNGFMYIPYMAQLAHGWTRFTIIVNSIAVAVLVPAIYFCVIQYGTIGAAAVWIVLNAGYVLIAIHFMHRVILSGEKWRWYGHSVVMPLFAAISTAYLMHALPIYEGVGAGKLAGAIFMVLIVTGIVTALATPIGRYGVSHIMTLIRNYPIFMRSKWMNR